MLSKQYISVPNKQNIIYDTNFVKTVQSTWSLEIEKHYR